MIVAFISPGKFSKFFFPVWNFVRSVKFFLQKQFLSVVAIKVSWNRTRFTSLWGCVVWLAKWCKIHKVYFHSHSMLLLIFTNIFIHIQQPNLHSRNIFIHIYLCISYSRLYLLTFTRCLHSHSTSYIHSHSRSKYSFNIFCAPPLRIGQCKTRTADWGLQTTDYGLG